MNSIVNISRRQASSSGGAAPADIRMITVWNVASDGETVTLPYKSGGTFSGTIDWGDSTVVANSIANKSHTYTSAGTYTIIIDGDVQGWAFENGGDKLKITDVSNWGTGFVFDRTRMFQGCVNMDITATDVPIITTTSFLGQFILSGITSVRDWSGWDVSGVTTFENCFYDCSAFNNNIANWVSSTTTNIKQMFNGASSFNQDLDSWDVSSVNSTENFLGSATSFDGSVAGWTINGVWLRAFNGCTAFTGTGVNTWNVSGLTSGQLMFVNCTLFNGDTSSWNTSALLTATSMFFNCAAYDQDMSGWDINQVTSLTNFMSGGTLSTANYDALLIAWDAQGAMSFSGTANFGGSRYTSGGAAEAAHISLEAKWGTIIDGGSV
jgi:surface protein